MPKITTKSVLQQHKLAPHKKLGQNFLVNPRTPELIVQAGNITKDDTIVEVGVGLGALTLPLAQKAKNVIGVEIDSGLIRYHQNEKILPENVSLIHNDILKVDFAELAQQSGTPLKIMANLPYSISNPFIFKLIENRIHIEWVVVMLQKEVAERLMAEPSSKEYGIPTVLLRSCAQIKKVMTLKPHEFHPQPKIDSLVIRIDFSPTPKHLTSLPLYDHLLFQRIVRSAFAKRRKMLLNNIAGINLHQSQVEISKQEKKEMAADIIQAAGLSPKIRAENLTLDDFINLTIEFSRWIKEQMPQYLERQ